MANQPHASTSVRRSPHPYAATPAVANRGLLPHGSVMPTELQRDYDDLSRYPTMHPANDNAAGVHQSLRDTAFEEFLADESAYRAYNRLTDEVLRLSSSQNEEERREALDMVFVHCRRLMGLMMKANSYMNGIYTAEIEGFREIDSGGIWELQHHNMFEQLCQRMVRTIQLIHTQENAAGRVGTSASLPTSRVSSPSANSQIRRRSAEFRSSSAPHDLRGPTHVPIPHTRIRVPSVPAVSSMNQILQWRAAHIAQSLYCTFLRPTYTTFSNSSSPPFRFAER
ncbi:hypothetical protein BDP27DRAFT_28821 [Rhodocollybia butyracea]|uniref:Uncharacterized protein n=1 Tax=Rhodocollybia butyracea TaxID=206335 RepID=A0A9P5QC48_9AGAR|nr:hypothetical protein BDP27DRAFT_28821 [Rhodocollybia butyracea]